MEVDPPGSLPETPAAPSPSLKRPQEEVNETAASAKRAKPEPAEDAEEGAVDTEANPRDETDKRGDKKKGQKPRGKKGKDKDQEYVRTRRRGTRPEGEEAPAADDGQPKAPRLPKRPCALLIGFCGDGYNGMQMYVDFSTIKFAQESLNVSQTA